jgi:hypothetical protein
MVDSLVAIDSFGDSGNNDFRQPSRFRIVLVWRVSGNCYPIYRHVVFPFDGLRTTAQWAALSYSFELYNTLPPVGKGCVALTGA